MIYLDNAATSFPKPRRVLDEVERSIREWGGNPGRSAHRMAMKAAEKIYACREDAASFFHAGKSENVIFTLNATMAVNLFVKGALGQGDHVLISDLEHNAVYRPIRKLSDAGVIRYDVFPSLANDPDATPEKIVAGIRSRIRPETKGVICTHASNICPAVLPLREIGALCREKGILFCADVSQSAGHIPIDMEEMRLDAICVPGHKGLLGPQGSGMLILGKEMRLETLIEGGSGVRSLDPGMPEDPPERYEAGTLPTPAIAGLGEGIREVRRIGVEAIGNREKELCAFLGEMLRTVPGVTVYTPHLTGSVLTFNLEGKTAEQVGRELDRNGICVRAGYHCAALAHGTIGTPEGGGVRVSPGYWNTRNDMEAVYRVVREIKGDGR